jgi:streptogramin lyase
MYTETVKRLERKLRTIQFQLKSQFDQISELDEQEDIETKQYLYQRMHQDFQYLVSTLDQLFAELSKQPKAPSSEMLGYLESFIVKDSPLEIPLEVPDSPDEESSVYESDTENIVVPVKRVKKADLSDDEAPRRSRRDSRQNSTQEKESPVKKRKRAIDPAEKSARRGRPTKTTPAKAKATPAKATASSKSTPSKTNTPSSAKRRRSGTTSSSSKKAKTKREIRQDNGLVVSLLAGGQKGISQDGIGESARFEDPAGITIGVDGYIYVTDNQKIRKISKDGQVTTFVDSTSSEFGPCEFVGINRRSDGHLFVTDWTGRVMGVTPDGALYEVAGNKGVKGMVDGEGREATFDGPSGIAIGPDGTIKLTEAVNGKIRSISSMGVVSTESADPDGPSDVVINSNGVVFIAEVSTHRVSFIDEHGTVAPFAGNGSMGHQDGDGNEATFHYPSALAIDKDDNIYVADMGNNLIRKINPNGDVVTIAGSGVRGKRNGPANVASFTAPGDLVVDDDGTVYVIDTGAGCIRRISKESVVEDAEYASSQLFHFDDDMIPGLETVDSTLVEGGTEDSVMGPEDSHQQEDEEIYEDAEEPQVHMEAEQESEEGEGNLEEEEMEGDVEEDGIGQELEGDQEALLEEE